MAVQPAPRELKLKVAESMQDDVQRGIARIDSQIMKELGIQHGTVVEISGSKRSVAIAARAYPSDIGAAIMRIDGITRRNAGTSIGEYVTVKPADLKAAKSVAIAPVQKGIFIQMPPQVFKRYLMSRPVVKGDIIALGGPRRRQRMTFSPFGDVSELFGAMEDITTGMFTDLKFVVVSTSPKETVLITEDTEIEILPEAVELKEEK